MSQDLDKIDIPFRSREYMIENPEKVFRMDPEQGSNRGFNGALMDNRAKPKEQKAEDAPIEPSEPVVQALDTVILSSEARQAADQTESGGAQSAPPPPPVPPVKQDDNAHVDILA